MYIKKYSTKPELARSEIHELIDKPTTHNWVEEREVLRIYQKTTKQVSKVLNHLRLISLRTVVNAAEAKAEGG